MRGYLLRNILAWRRLGYPEIVKEEQRRLVELRKARRVGY